MRTCFIPAIFVLSVSWASAFAQSCTGLCLQQQACPAGGTTTVSGTVFAPNGVDPLPNVLVYVPNGPVSPFPPGVQCLPDGQAVTGSPLVQALSGDDGKFILSNMPVGNNIPLVIQAGRWRRQATIPSVAACASTPVDPTLTHLPRNKAEGDIPRIAIVTGSVDSTECLLRKIGIADSEFTDPQGTGRINLYEGAGSAGAQCTPATPGEAQLWSGQAALNQYDMVMFSCQGQPFEQTAAAKANLVNYANAGGRVFASHFAYTWLYNAPPFSSAANWAVNQTASLPVSSIAVVNQAFPKGAQLARWLMTVGASTKLGEVAVTSARRDLTGVMAPSQSWLSITDLQLGPAPAQFTFDTPFGAAPANQCGRVLFNDYHVEASGATAAMTFPQECTSGPMTGQEKLLEFDIFELTGGEYVVAASATPPTQAALTGNLPTSTPLVVNPSPATAGPCISLNLNCSVPVQPITAPIAPDLINFTTPPAIRPQAVWGVDSTNSIWFWTGTAWHQVPGILSYVSLGTDGTVWGIGSAGSIVSWTGSAWQPMPGTAAQISVGDARTIWSVGANGAISRWTGAAWQTVPGALTNVSAAADGAVWGVNATGMVWRWTGTAWELMPGTMKQVSVGNGGNVWALDAQDKIYRWSGSAWQQVPGALRSVSVDANGTAWGVNAGGQIWFWSGSAWQEVGGGPFVQVSSR